MNLKSQLLTVCLAAAAACTVGAPRAQAAVMPTVYSTSTPVVIADLSTATAVLDVTAHGLLLDVNALIDITHGYDADLTLSLSHGGTTVLLSNRQGGSGGANYTGTIFDDQASVAIDAGFAYAPYTGAFRPQEALARFIGADVFGRWTLIVTDNEEGDSGTINRFGIAVSAQAAEVPEPGSLALFGAALFGFGGAARRLRRKA